MCVVKHACGDSAVKDTSESVSPNGKTALERTIEPQLDAIEKAKKIEDSLQKSVMEREKQMQERGL